MTHRIYVFPDGTQYAVTDEDMQRAWSRIRKSSDGCWLQTSGLNYGGYGSYSIAGRTVRTHRFMYVVHRGPIASDVVLDHLCRNRACCNPEHLDPVANELNVERGMSPSAVNARKSHCLRGHPFDAENTEVRPGGGRACKECRRIRDREETREALREKNRNRMAKVREEKRLK